MMTPAAVKDVVAEIRSRAAGQMLDAVRDEPRRFAAGRDLGMSGGVRSARHADGSLIFRVSGSQSRHYTVTLRGAQQAMTRLPACCSCPDFTKGSQVCKHMVAAMHCVVDGNLAELLTISQAEEPPVSSALVAVPEAWAGPLRWTTSTGLTIVQKPGDPEEGAVRKVAPESTAAALGPPPGAPFTLTQAVRGLRAAEAEAAALRAEVESLQAQVALATDVGAGPKARFVSAAETLTQWRELCSEAESFIYIACFMFDLPNVVTMLEMARKRGVTVRLIFSDRDRAQATNQAPALQQLRGRGCEIRSHKGQRLHAKWLMTERGILLGSTNFTSASQRNMERGVVLTGLSEAEMLAEQGWFERLFDNAAKFTAGIGEPMPPSPAR